MLFGVFCLQIYYRIEKKTVHFIFASIILFILFCISILSKVPVAHAEELKIVTQLQHHNLTLLKARIELIKFPNQIPHFFTIFNKISEDGNTFN